jgi:hypothetical protein
MNCTVTVRLCLLCEHWSFSPGDPGWSEVTPGWDATCECTRGHWALDMIQDNQDTFREKMQSATTCEEFEAANE